MSYDDMMRLVFLGAGLYIWYVGWAGFEKSYA